MLTIRFRFATFRYHNLLHINNNYTKYISKTTHTFYSQKAHQVMLSNASYGVSILSTWRKFVVLNGTGLCRCSKPWEWCKEVRGIDESLGYIVQQSIRGMADLDAKHTYPNKSSISTLNTTFIAAMFWNRKKKCWYKQIYTRALKLTMTTHDRTPSLDYCLVV